MARDPVTKFQDEMRGLGLGVSITLPGQEPVVICEPPDREEPPVATTETDLADGELLPGETIEEAAERLTGRVADIIDEALERDGAQPLFSPHAYDDPRLKLETKDGRHVNEIVLKFTGTITLNRRVPNDVALYKSLTLGKEVSYRVEANVAGNADTIKPATEKTGELLVGTRTLRVHSLVVDDE